MRSLKRLRIRPVIKELAIIFGTPTGSVLIVHLAVDPEPDRLINVAVGSFSAVCIGRMIIAVKRLPRQPWE